MKKPCLIGDIYCIQLIYEGTSFRLQGNPPTMRKAIKNIGKIVIPVVVFLHITPKKIPKI